MFHDDRFFSSRTDPFFMQNVSSPRTDHVSMSHGSFSHDGFFHQYSLSVVDMSRTTLRLLNIL